MTTEQTLPAVAQKVYIECKKCNAERYHVVLAHKTATSAKVECEVCKKKSTYSIAKKVKKPAKKRSAVVSGAKWTELIEKAKGNPVPYTMKGKFGIDTAIQHPKFGLGVIIQSQPGQIEVVFEVGTKNLIHNRA